MDSNKLKEVLYAYSAGCLDKEDYPLLINYINSANRMFAGELADMQNILALIPSILEIEQPNQKVKDKVARKLYRLRNESRVEKKKLTMNPIVSETTKETIKADETSIGETVGNSWQKKPSYIPLAEPAAVPEYKSVIQNELVEYKDPLENSGNEGPENEEEEITASGKKPEIPEEIVLQHNQEMAELKYERPEFYENELQKTPKEKSSKGLVYFIISVLVTILLCGGVYFMMSQEIVKNKEQIVSLRTQVNSLVVQMEKLEKNQRVLALLGAKDTKTYNLDATEANPKGFGKLTISPEGKEGVLQLYNMPALSGNQVYQLWVTNKDQSISMGAFSTKRDVEYFAVEQLPIDQALIMSFIVTLEENGGSAAPSKKVYLSGSLNKM